MLAACEVPGEHCPYSTMKAWECWFCCDGEISPSALGAQQGRSTQRKVKEAKGGKITQSEILSFNLGHYPKVSVWVGHSTSMETIRVLQVRLPAEVILICGKMTLKPTIILSICWLYITTGVRWCFHTYKECIFSI